MTFETLPAAIANLRVRIDKEVNDATKEVAAVVLKGAASNTPVDTSKALSNWRIGIDVRPAGVTGPRVPGNDGSSELASLQATVNAGRNAMVGRKVGQEIHIANNTNYIEDLNNGKSYRKPGGFVEKAILLGRIQIAKTVIRLN